jgi:hypothetical protein
VFRIIPAAIVLTIETMLDGYIRRAALGFERPNPYISFAEQGVIRLLEIDVLRETSLRM